MCVLAYQLTQGWRAGTWRYVVNVSNSHQAKEKEVRVFRRLSDDGHASVFKARVSSDLIVLEIASATSLMRMITSLSKEDAKRFAAWLQTKTE